MIFDPLIVVARLAQLFDDLQVPYVVGGSFASSLYGTPRSTEDVDFMAQLKLAHVEPLVKALEADFYVAGEAVTDAIRRHGSFNVIHLATMFKADIFVPKQDAWLREEMDRARSEVIQLNEISRTIRFSSPEDTILHKLLWFKLGGSLSDRQWTDILGVFRIQGQSLDFDYLERWAALLHLSDLFLRARAEGPF